MFGDHALVSINGQIYDPSYGKGPFSGTIDWEDNSIDGFGVQFIDQSELSANFLLWVGSLRQKGVEELNVE